MSELSETTPPEGDGQDELGQESVALVPAGLAVQGQVLRRAPRFDDLFNY